MDQSISAIIGAVIFTAFVVGLAQSIASIPFFIIVLIVVVLMGTSAFELIKEQLGWGASKEASKK